MKGVVFRWCRSFPCLYVFIMSMDQTCESDIYIWCSELQWLPPDDSACHFPPSKRKLWKWHAETSSDWRVKTIFLFMADGLGFELKVHEGVWLGIRRLNQLGHVCCVYIYWRKIFWRSSPYVPPSSPNVPLWSKAISPELLSGSGWNFACNGGFGRVNYKPNFSQIRPIVPEILLWTIKVHLD